MALQGANSIVDLWADRENAISGHVAETVLVHREGQLGRNQGTVIAFDGNSGVMSKLRECDITMFMAICQSLKVPLLPFMAKFEHSELRGRGTHVINVSQNQGVVFKTLYVDDKLSESRIRGILISEIIVLQHPLLRKHPNLQHLEGVAWDIDHHEGEILHVMPVLAFKETKLGTLEDLLLRNSFNGLDGFIIRLRFCYQIASAIEALHKLDIIHGDIKPQNVLIFREDGHLVAKVIDFGSSCFGAKATDRFRLTSYTPGWESPEFREEGHQFTVEGAKLADIYSFGKVCAWCLLWHTKLISDFTSETTFNIDAAIDQLSSHDSSAGHDNDLSEYFRVIAPVLKEFLNSTFCMEVEHRTDFTTAKRRLLSMIRTWELHFNKVGPRTTTIGAVAAWLTACPRHTTLFIRGCAMKFMALLIQQRRKSEFSISGDPQFNLHEDDIYLTLNVIWLTGCLAFGLFLLVKAFLLKTRNRLIWLLSLAFIMWLFGLYGSWQIWRNKTRYRTYIQSFKAIGHNQHLVPHLPPLFPVLNRVHHAVRKEIVNGLIQSAENNGDRACQICKSQSAMQLALCRKTSFGKFEKNARVTSYEYWLTKSGKNNVADLCREVDFWEDRYDRPVALLGITSKSEAQFAIDLSEDQIYHHNLYKTISNYREEIRGKIDANVCLSTALVLLESLGNLCMKCHMYKDAESAFRDAAQLVLKLNSRHPNRRGLFLFHTYDRTLFAKSLASALSHQGRRQETTVVVKSHILMLQSLANTRPFMFFRASKSIKREMASQQIVRNKFWLLQLLVEDNKLQEAASQAFELLGDVKGKKNLIEFGEAGYLLLARALVNASQANVGIQILRSFLGLKSQIFGDAPEKVFLAKLELTKALVFGTDVDIDESLVIQDSLLEDSTYDGDQKVVEIMTIRSVALARKKFWTDTTCTIDHMLQHIQAAFSDADCVPLGCMTDLAGSLCLEGKEALQTPIRLRGAVSEMLKRSSSFPAIQERLITLFWMLSWVHFLEPTIIQIERLLDLLTSTYTQQLEMIVELQSMLSFILIHWGFTYGDQSALDKALAICKEARQLESQAQGGQSLQMAEIINLIASVYAKKVILMCHYDGFGLEELSLFDEALTAQRLALEKNRTILGENNRFTLDALTRQARVLAVIGTALDNEDYVSESRTLFETIISSDTSGRKDQAKYYFLTLHTWRTSEAVVKDLVPAYNSMRKWLVGDCRSNCYCPGDLALVDNLVKACSTYNSNERLTKWANHKLLHAYENFVDYRKQYRPPGHLHPDYLKSLETQTKLEFAHGSPLTPVQAHHPRFLPARRYIDWLAKRVHKAISQQQPVMRYRMCLAVGLAADVYYRSESVIVATETVHLCKSQNGLQHTQTADFMKELAWCLSENGQEEQAEDAYRECLEIRLDIFGSTNIATTSAWDALERRIVERVHRLLVSDKVDRIINKAMAKCREIDEIQMEECRRLGCRAALATEFLGPTHGFSRGTDVEFCRIVGLCGLNNDQITAALEEIHAEDAGTSQNPQTPTALELYRAGT